jgi:hypothetical protein
VHLNAPDGLWIQNSTWNAHQATIKWGDEVLAKATFSGEEVHEFPLPAGKGGSKPLTIEIDAPVDGSSCIIRGGAGKPPPIK